MTLPDLPPVLELDVSMPGVSVDTTSYVAQLIPDIDGPEVVGVIIPGPPGPAGPPGEGGFTHVQSTPAATWTIPNPLGRYPLGVMIVVDNAVVTTDVEFPAVDLITVTFANPVSGRAEVI